MLTAQGQSGPQKLADLKPPPLHMLVYGPTGAGKTVMACSSQKLRTLLLDIDNGALSALAWPKTRKEYVTRFRCKDFNSVFEAIKWAQNNKSQFDLLVVDTITELQGKVVEEVCRVAKVDTASQREWGIILSMMRKLTRFILDLEMHVIFLAHEKCIIDDQTKRPFWRPDLQGRFGDEYSKWFSVIARYEMAEKVVKNEAGQAQLQTIRGLRCHRTPQIEAKDRSDRLNKSALEEPDLDHIIDTFYSAITTE